MMNNQILSISALVSYVKDKLTTDSFLKNVKVQGEIGNFTNHYSGHWYFTLKDNGALINCAMFKGSNQFQRFIPKNGDKVCVSGSVNVFEKSGQMQLIISKMELAGAGNFYMQFQLMREKLEPLGFFDPSRKKKIPKYPQTISVVTGANTAALQDIKITIAKRWPFVELRVVPAIVQGNEAIKSIVQGLDVADKQNSDVIILARGGGSVDDLWCFNDEQIARKIYSLKTPIVTGIGHEIDTTIADLVADERCATPTAAAQRVTPDVKNVIEKIDSSVATLKKFTLDRYYQNVQTLDYFNSKLINSSLVVEKQNRKLELMMNIINAEMTKKSLLSSKKYDALINQLSQSGQQLSKTTSLKVQRIDNGNKTNLLALLNRCSSQLSIINNLNQMNNQIVSNKLKNAYSDLYNQINLLDSVSPLQVLKRGFSITSQSQQIIKSIDQVDMTQPINIRFNDGNLLSMPVKKEK